MAFSTLIPEIDDPFDSCAGQTLAGRVAPYRRHTRADCCRVRPRSVLWFSPLLGLHTILGVIAAFLLSLNRVAVLLGVYSNLPWFLAPYYAVATMAGAELTGHHPPPDFREQVGGLFKLSLWQGISGTGSSS